MTLIIYLGYLVIAFNTVKYAMQVWKGGNLLAGFLISILSFILASFPMYVLFR